MLLPRRRNHPSVLRRAIHDAIGSQAVGSIFSQMLVEGGVLALMILHFGGTEADVGVNATLYNLCMVAGLLTIPYLETRSRKRMIFRWLTGSAFVLFLLFLVFPVARIAGGRGAIRFILGVTFLFGATTNVGSSAWMPYLSGLVPRSIRGRFFGSLRTWWRATSFAGTVAAGWILGKEPDDLRFALALGIGALGSLFYGYYLARLPELPPEREGAATESAVANVRAVLRDPLFRRFLSVVFVIYVVQTAATPFMVAFLKRSLGFPSSFSVYSASSISVGAILSLLAWGRLSDRRGSRLVFMASLFLTASSIAALALVPRYDRAGVAALAAAAGAFLLLGIGVSGLTMGYTVRLMLEAPSGYTGTAMAISRTAVGIATALSPVVAGAVLAALRRQAEATAAAAGTAPSPDGQRLYFLAVAALLASTALLVGLLRHIAEPSARSVLRAAVSAVARGPRRRAPGSPGSRD